MSNISKIIVFVIIFLLANINLYLISIDSNDIGYAAAPTLLYVLYGIILLKREKKIARIKSWPQVKGLVSSVTEHQSVLGKFKYGFEFCYQINDISYQGDRFSYSGKLADIGFLKMHPSFRAYIPIDQITGRAARVYYNPKNKSEGYLVNQYSDDYFIKHLDLTSFVYTSLLIIKHISLSIS
jgi:hypothetical protein